MSFYTALASDEIVTAVRVPEPQPGTHAVYEKFVTNSSEDCVCVGVPASIRLSADNGVYQDVRAAVRDASETPQRFRWNFGAGHHRGLGLRIKRPADFTLGSLRWTKERAHAARDSWDRILGGGDRPSG